MHSNRRKRRERRINDPHPKTSCIGATPANESGNPCKPYTHCFLCFLLFKHLPFSSHCLRAFAILTAALLVSCIDGREEIWLHADGSGRADIAYSLPAAAAKFQGGETGVRAMIGDFLSKTPALTSSACEVTTVGDQLNIRVTAAFKSISDFKQVSTGSPLDALPSTATHLTGEILAKREGLSFAFSRTISAGKALPGALFMPKSQFEGRNLTYIVHLPKAATESNATRIEDDGRTLIWEFPLEQALRHPVTTRFKAPIPLFTSLVTAAGTTATLILGALVIMKLRRTKRTSSFGFFKPRMDANERE